MKKLCKEKNIPTAILIVILETSLKFLKKNELPLVVKADGLAAVGSQFVKLKTSFKYFERNIQRKI